MKIRFCTQKHSRTHTNCSHVRPLRQYVIYEGHPFVNLLPPSTKLGQGNIFSSVCQEFCPRGDLPDCMLGYPPGPGTLPLDQKHPPGPGRPPGTVHAGRYGQQVGGTHPTGMQSYYHLQTKFGQGNIFTRVCQEFCSREGCLVPGGM